MSADTLVSVLLVTGDERPHLERRLAAIHAVCSAAFHFFEIVVIDNASTDGTGAWMLDQLEHLPNCRYLRLSRRYPLEVAQTAAFENCMGDVAVVMDLYSDPPGAIPQLVAAATGNTVVVAGRDPRLRGPMYTAAAAVFYGVARRLTGMNLSTQVSAFRAYPRAVVTALTKVKHRRRNPAYLSSLVGFPQIQVPVELAPETPQRPRESFRQAVARAFDLLFSYSGRPLRMVSLVGLLAAFGNVAYLLYVLVVALVKDHVAEGWITTSVVIGGMFFALFLILAVMAEYIARILDEVQERPLYFVEVERDSTVTASRTQQPLNVV